MARKFGLDSWMCFSFVIFYGLYHGIYHHIFGTFPKHQTCKSKFVWVAVVYPGTLSLRGWHERMGGELLWCLRRKNTRLVVSNIFNVHPNLGKIPILTNIFQMGWFNHQPSCWLKTHREKPTEHWMWKWILLLSSRFSMKEAWPTRSSANKRPDPARGGRKSK